MICTGLSVLVHLVLWPETLPTADRIPFQMGNLNPFKPLVFFFQNTAYRCLFFVMLVEQLAGSGFNALVFNYVVLFFVTFLMRVSDSNHSKSTLVLQTILAMHIFSSFASPVLGSSHSHALDHLGRTPQVAAFDASQGLFIAALAMFSTWSLFFFSTFVYRVLQVSDSDDHQSTMVSVDRPSSYISSRRSCPTRTRMLTFSCLERPRTNFPQVHVVIGCRARGFASFVICSTPYIS
jgi:hypothetical protein